MSLNNAFKNPDYQQFLLLYCYDIKFTRGIIAAILKIQISASLSKRRQLDDIVYICPFNDLPVLPVLAFQIRYHFNRYFIIPKVREKEINSLSLTKLWFRNLTKINQHGGW